MADILACLKNDRYNEVSQCEKGNHFCIYMFWSRNNTYVDSFTRDHPHMTSAFWAIPTQYGRYIGMDPNQILTEPSVKELYPHCGRSSSTRDLRTGLNNESRIYYGEDASPGEFPWMVMVQLYHPEASRLCAGSLISVRWIITTAFCVAGAESNITDFQSFARYGHLVMYIHT